MYETILYFFKADSRAIIPSKRDEDAGYDVYMLPTKEAVIIMPGETYLADTGLRSAFEKDYVLIGKERGSTGTKGLRFGAGVFDSGYRNNLLIPINNTNNVPIVLLPEGHKYTEDDNSLIYHQEKAIGQLLLIPLAKAKLKEVDEETFNSFTSERGMGRLGSSNK